MVEKRIVNWIRKQIKQARAKGAVIGLSGGLDSAVAAALCSKALGRNRVLALMLPCDSQQRDLLDARLIARKLNLKARLIDLGPVYKAYLKLLPKANKLAYANLKVRLRMLTLYYFANKLDYLVCGTSNKSELLTGYFTKYGDGASDILPLGNLLKTQVREIAVDLHIPRRIIDRKPTAGLWPGQTDEAELGLSYNQLDDILLRLSRKQKQTHPASLVKKIKYRIRSSGHKRRIPQICKI